MANTMTDEREPAEWPNVRPRSRGIGSRGSLWIVAVLAVVVLTIFGGLGLSGIREASGGTPSPSLGSAHLHVLSSGAYAVSFNESGLPLGTYWGVTDNGSTQYSTAPSIVFVDPNGTSNYSIAPVAGYSTNWSGSLTVNGTNATVPISFSPFSYALEFTETGLPTRTTWGVSCGGDSETTNTLALIFLEPNGTYSWAVAPIAGYTTNSTGVVNITGADAAVPVPFSPQVDYSVVFNETGLPSGTDWTVTVGSASASSNSNSLTVTEPNGSYAWAITPVAGFTTDWTGSLTVAGANVSVSVVFTPPTYSLLFAETGLPSGTPWTVTIGSASTSSTSASVLFVEPNGSYSWAITPIAGYSTTWSGATQLSGANVTLSIDFAEFVYAVTFTETGLAASTTWEATLASVSEYSNGSSIVFSEPNGTFTFAISPVTGYTTMGTGSVTVDASSASVDVGFTMVSYALIFIERHLPTGTNWMVSIGSSTLSSTSQEIGFPEPDGTYGWSVTPIPGYTTTWTGSSTVQGGDELVDVTFARVTYPLVFVETGLPTGTMWGASVGGTTISGRNASLVAAEPNGTVSFSVLPIAGYSTTGSMSPVTVSGAGQSLPIAFEAVDYVVTFEETGLPGGTPWSVTLSGGPGSSSTGAITFAVANGTYSYDVPSIPGYTTAATGIVTVSGADRAVAVAFVPFVSAVTFVPIGLPQGTSWGVALAGRSSTETGGPIAFNEANGTYSYSVSAVPGFLTTWAGSVQVQGSAIVVSVRFVVMGYAIGFHETGLPSGATWAVSIGSQSAAGPGGSLSLVEPNGSYTYEILPVPGYAAMPSGPLTVDDAAQTVSVAFQPASFAQTFRETGLPAGTNWSVTITATGTTAPGSVGASVTVWSDGASSIVCSLTNGTYSYTTDAPGFAAVRGTLGVSGMGPSAVTVPMVSVTPSPSSSATLYGELGALAGLAAVIAALAFLWGRQRGRKTATVRRDPDADEP
jgi:hypothetical protein